MKQVQYKGYTICIIVAVCIKETEVIVNEFESIRDAKKEYSDRYYDFWYLAAEIIDKDGNTNPACWGKTRNDALLKLKRALGWR